MPMVDKWNGLAVLLTNLIEKYAVDLDIESLPDPVFIEREGEKCDTDKDVHKTDKDVHKKNVETPMVA
jgi:hypothetical protein